MKRTVLHILIDAFRSDYLGPDDTPYLWSLKDKGIYVKELYNPGGYCERSCFMTGAGPEVTDNYFAMALKPVGYARPYYEVKFSVPKVIRDKLAMTEDQTIDDTPNSFINWTTGEVIDSIYDVMRREGKTWHVEACQALGVQSKQGRTTHGSRVVQMVNAIEKECDYYYWQISDTDQRLHYRGTGKNERRPILRKADSDIKTVVEKFKKHFDHVDLIIGGDHGMSDVVHRVNLEIDYEGFELGWDYLYLKSSAAIQFWVFNPQVAGEILNDERLLNTGEFIESPTRRQGDIIWRAHHGMLVSPCHFHPAGDPIKAMHGWDPGHPEQMGMTIVVDGEHTGVVDRADLRDWCPTITNLLGIPVPMYNEGESLI